jgi:hypothetical protein
MPKKFSKTKKCIDCGKLKNREECFYKRNGNSDGRQNRCKDCTRVKRADSIKAWSKANPDKRRRTSKNSSLKKKYGITIEQYEEMYEDQDGLCMVCLRPNTIMGVDHNHRTGKVRALLCYQCNWGIGMAGESIQVLQSMIDYLRHYNEEV